MIMVQRLLLEDTAQKIAPGGHFNIDILFNQ